MATANDSGSSNKADKKPPRRLLGRRVDLPSGGKLGKTIRWPKFLRAIGSYFAGAYRELRQVSWPTRRATWVLTLAVIVFTLVVAVIIVLLDLGFEQLFKRIIL